MPGKSCQELDIKMLCSPLLIDLVYPIYILRRTKCPSACSDPPHLIQALTIGGHIRRLCIQGLSENRERERQGIGYPVVKYTRS